MKTKPSMCVFERTKKPTVYRCRNRGCHVHVVEERFPPENVHRQCHGIASWGAGDLLAWTLRRLGFEKRPTCGCAKRQRNLNRVGWELVNRINRVRLWVKRNLMGQ